MKFKVRIKFVGVFRVASGANEMLVELKKPSNVGDVIQRLLGSSHRLKSVLVDPELEDPRVNALILVNGVEISVLEGLETPVESEDEIVVVPVAHGG